MAVFSENCTKCENAVPFTFMQVGCTGSGHYDLNG